MKLDGLISSGGAHIHNPIVEYKTASLVEISAPDAPQRIMLDGDIVAVADNPEDAISAL